MSDSGKNWIDSATQVIEPGQYFEQEPAIEVAAMLDDSLVEVKHLTRDRDPGSDKRCFVWYGIGATLLVLAVAAFAIAVGNAADNKLALAVWTEAGKPLHEFRPHRISLAYDWMAFGGAIGGMFAIGFGLWRRRTNKPVSTFRIGDEFTLVAPSADGFVCNFSPAMDGDVIDGANISSFADVVERGRARPSASMPGALEVPIPRHGRIKVRHGKTTYILATVPPPRQQSIGVIARIESRSLMHFAGSALAHGLLLALIYNLPATPRTLTGDPLGDDSERLRRAQLMAFEEPAPELTEDDDAESTDNPNEGNAGGAEMSDAGKQGVQDSNNADGRLLIKKRRETQEMSRGEALAVARNSGVLYVFNSSHAGAQDPFATITGTTFDYSSGIGDRDVFGGYTGDEFRNAYGGWGSGVYGTGPGGGGDKYGTIGTGNYNTIGDTGLGDTSFYNGRPPGKRLIRNPKAPETLELGKVQSGQYDKALIRRYIKQQRNRLRHCYERELVVDRTLEGTITSVFIINDRGAVVSSLASGMGSKNVEDCIAETVKSIQFPAPDEGGMHKVTYPFHFHHAGN